MTIASAYNILILHIFISLAYPARWAAFKKGRYEVGSTFLPHQSLKKSCQQREVVVDSGSATPVRDSCFLFILYIPGPLPRHYTRQAWRQLYIYIHAYIPLRPTYESPRCWLLLRCKSIPDAVGSMTIICCQIAKNRSYPELIQRN
ncbi:hypothetical protein F4809DRAFT_635878 [Biscogniauxia mediterranea]|nr:hypothetical protein F4809DRAFT_635878 [Biscogniauxia mediterranea]